MGPLDERFWLYGEDLDWCYRYWEAGWPVFYSPGITVIHAKGGSSGAFRSWKTNRAFHGCMWLFYRKHQFSRNGPVLNAAVWAGIWMRLLVSAGRGALHRARGELDQASSSVLDRRGWRMSDTVRVFVDATSCKSQQGGVRTYTLAMCEALASHDGVSLAIATSIPDFDELPVDAFFECRAQPKRRPPVHCGASGHYLRPFVGLALRLCLAPYQSFPCANCRCRQWSSYTTSDACCTRSVRTIALVALSRHSAAHATNGDEGRLRERGDAQ